MLVSKLGETELLHAITTIYITKYPK